jgi:AraC-like DNA-binding protein
MKPIPLHKVAVVKPFTQFLNTIGAPFERDFRKLGLPICALEDVNNFVPSHRFWTFLVDMSYKEGIPDLGFLVGQKYGANCVDPHLTNLLIQSPTLYQGLISASEIINKTVSNCRVGLLQPPNSKYSYFFHEPSCDRNNPAIEQIGWYGIFPFIGIARIFLGSEWLPDEIGIMVNHAPSPIISEQFPDTYIRLEQPFCYITLKNTQLSLPPQNHPATTDGYQTWHHAELPFDFIESVEQLMRSYVCEEKLTLEFVAKICEMSKRSFQRKLAENSTHYSQMLDNARFDIAKQLLQDGNNSINDISQMLYYSDATHFARAFRRIAGMPPQLYRKQFLK